MLAVIQHLQREGPPERATVDEGKRPGRWLHVVAPRFGKHGLHGVVDRHLSRIVLVHRPVQHHDDLAGCSLGDTEVDGRKIHRQFGNVGQNEKSGWVIRRFRLVNVIVEGRARAIDAFQPGFIAVGDRSRPCQSGEENQHQRAATPETSCGLVVQVDSHSAAQNRVS